jgi:hypothetical protein
VSSKYDIKCNRITGKMVQDDAHSPGGCHSKRALKLSGEITSMVRIYFEDGSLLL